MSKKCILIFCDNGRVVVLYLSFITDFFKYYNWIRSKLFRLNLLLVRLLSGVYCIRVQSVYWAYTINFVLF